MRSQLLRRGASLLAVSALSVTTLGALSSPASADPAGDRATSAGAAWLKGQLTNGLVVGEYTGTDGQPVEYDDYGLSADFALALDAVGGHDATVTQIADAVAPKVTSWYDSFGTIYTGSAAKAAVLAQTAGKDATSFGGQDLIDVVESRTADADPIVGRVQNEGEFDFEPPYGPVDSLNVISQSFASRALTNAGSTDADAVTSFLFKQQCLNEGFFRATLSADKTSPDQSCVAGAADSVPSVDTTALVLINLLETDFLYGSSGLDLRIDNAASWLVSQQAADGSFSAGGAEGYNANSTGLAGWALAAVALERNSSVPTLTNAAAKAASWLRGVQIADLAPCVTTLAAENGAVAFKPSTLTMIRTAGAIATGQRDQFRRATAQALPALAQLPAGGTLAITAPAAAVEKSTVTVTVAGLGIGEAACVGLGSVGKSVTGTGSDLTVTFDLPAGAGARTFTLTTLAGTQTATTVASLAPVPPTVPPVAPAPATPEVGALKTSKVELVKKNTFKLAVTCDDTEACDGKIVVRTAGKVKVGDKKKARKVLIAKKSYSVAPGDTEQVVLKVRKPARAALDSGRIKVKAVQTAVGAERDVTKFWLREK